MTRAARGASHDPEVFVQRRARASGAEPAVANRGNPATRSSRRPTLLLLSPFRGTALVSPRTMKRLLGTTSGHSPARFHVVVSPADASVRRPSDPVVTPSRAGVCFDADIPALDHPPARRDIDAAEPRPIW